MSHIKAVLSDIGNVIMPVQTEFFIKNLVEKSGADMTVVNDVVRKTIAVEHEINRGRRTIRQAFDEFIAQPLNI
ncbi:MAG TPA: hypothetical protein PKK48_07655, partial [Phycisphaerae bacterium]|nr:hypothetical protein [Phycisphaerae bacterium]